MPASNFLHPKDFERKLHYYITGGVAAPFIEEYRLLYEEVVHLEDASDELREVRDEVSDLRVRVQDLSLDLIEAKAELEKLRSKPKPKPKTEA